MPNNALILLGLAVVGGLSATTAAVEFDSYQFTDGNYSVFWYVLPGGDSVKFMYHYDFGESPAGKWLGLGFRDPDGAGMGPGVFYTGDADYLNVTSREKTDSGTGYPNAWDDPSLTASGCEIVDTTLYCFIVRDVNGAANSPNLDLSTAQTTILWAWGPTSDGDISYHQDNYGLSSGLNVVDNAPTLPSIVSDGTITVSWCPTPLGNLDVYMTADFSADGVDNKWVGFGVGNSSSSMGPGEFYTGQSANSTTITNRWLGSGDGYPVPKSSDITVLDTMTASPGGVCTTQGTDLTCSFSRPLATSGGETMDLTTAVYVLWAVGPMEDGGISFHSSKAITGETVALYNISVTSVAPASNILYQLHGILMVVCWLWLLPFGIFVARFREVLGMSKKKDGKPPIWWRIHQANQYTGVILMTASIIIIFVQKGEAWTAHGYPFTSYTGGVHPIAGIISFVLTLLQPMMATMRNGVNEKNETKAHRCHHIWHIGHALCGYAALFLALLSVGLGIEEYNSSSGWPGLFTLGFIISVGCLFFAAIAGVGLVVTRLKATSRQTTTTTTGVVAHRQGSFGATRSTVFEKGAVEEHLLEDERDNLPTHMWVAWLLYFLLFVGAVMSATNIALDEARELTHTFIGNN